MKRLIFAEYLEECKRCENCKKIFPTINFYSLDLKSAYNIDKCCISCADNKNKKNELSKTQKYINATFKW